MFAIIVAEEGFGSSIASFLGKAGSLLQSLLFSPYVKIVVILFLGLTLSKLVSRSVEVIIRWLGFARIRMLSTEVQMLDKILGSVFLAAGYVATFYIIFNILGIVNVFIYFFSITLLFFVLVSLFITLWDLVPKLISTIAVLLNKDLKKGRKVEFRGIKGVIDEFFMTRVKIIAKNGDVLFVPSSMFHKEMLILHNKPKKKA